MSRASPNPTRISFLTCARTHVVPAARRLRDTARQTRLLPRASPSDGRDAALSRIERAGTPLVLTSVDMCDEIVYSSDVMRATGSRDVGALSERALERYARDLREVKCQVVSVGNIAKDEYIVRWSVEFVPEKMKWLYDTALSWPFGELKIEKYDILDRMGDISRFTYAALFALLKRALLEKVMRIPIAKIEGSSTLIFSDVDGKLVRHSESLALVACVNAGQVQNKRICRDVLEYLDARKPPGVSLEDWDIQVEDKVDIYSVPGMRQLDIDGMEDQAGSIEDATALLGFFTLIILTFGFGFGGIYLHGLQQEAAIRQMLDTGAY